MMLSIRQLLALVAISSLFAGSVHAEGKMEPPVPVRTVAPEMPVEFSRNGNTGLVTVNFLVDEQGAVQDAKIEKTTQVSLGEPALRAVRKWKFKPAKRDGAPVAIRVSIPRSPEFTRKRIWYRLRPRSPRPPAVASR